MLLRAPKSAGGGACFTCAAGWAYWSWLQEYLKWKRQQKGAAAESSDEEQQQGSATNGSSSNNTHLQAGKAPAATGSIPCAPAGTQQQHRQQQRARDSTADDPTQPLQYRPLVALPAAPFTAAGPAAAAEAAAEPIQGTDNSAATAAEASTPAAAAGVVYMPRLDPAEVGFTPEGFALDMPTRPAWQVSRGTFGTCTFQPAALPGCST